MQQFFLQTAHQTTLLKSIPWALPSIWQA